VILCDHHIEKAERDGRIVFDPRLDPARLESSALNLRVGDDFLMWKAGLRARGAKTHIELDNIDLSELISFADPLEPNADGVVVIPPAGFVLVRTLEYISLPLKGRLAARVEGRSKLARLGMTAHITAPTIHAGFRGKIMLEIVNHGPFRLEVIPNQTELCQLVFEEVSAVPRRGGSRAFSDQSTPLGTPKRTKGR
jgi:dCTP deaminase